MKLTRRNFLGASTSAVAFPRIGPWQEYKEGIKTYGDWFKPALTIVDGAITVPQGAGVGLSDQKEIFKDAEVIRS